MVGGVSAVLFLFSTVEEVVLSVTCWTWTSRSPSGVWGIKVGMGVVEGMLMLTGRVPVAVGVARGEVS